MSYLGTNIYYELTFKVLLMRFFLCVYSLCLYKFNYSFKMFTASTVSSAQEPFPNTLGHLQNRNISCDSKGQTTKARFLYG